MKKYKKKHKLRIDVLLLFLLIIAIITVSTCISIVSFVKEKPLSKLNIKDTHTFSGIDKNNYQKFFNFKGNVIKEVLIDNHYLSTLYMDDNKYVSHFIDLYLGKEIGINDLIKNNSIGHFNEKIEKLLKLKYPSSVIKKLNKMDNAYFLDNNEMYIYYNNIDTIETTREFNLRVDYNEIKDFLIFKPVLNEVYQNENGYDYDPNKITVAFTFDDGPSDDYTIRIVKSLEEFKMSATFFMVGYKLEKYADIVKKVEESHSEVGYHSYSHTRFTEQTPLQIKNDFTKSDNLFFEITGNHLTLTRPPYGNFNKDVLNSINTAFIRWNIDTNDWKYKDTDYLVSYVLENIKNHAIILFHDSYQTSVEAASILMEKLYYQDIQVVNVTELAKLTNTSLEKHQMYYSFD